MNNAHWRTATSSAPASDSTLLPQRQQQHHQQEFKIESDAPVQHHHGSQDAAPGQHSPLPRSSAGGGSSSKDAASKPILQSCQFCRKRKIKCDKLDGGCSQCARAQMECVYPVSQRKGRPRKPGTKTHVAGPAPTPREEALLKKVWRLEGVIESLTGRGGAGGMSLDQSVEHPLREQLDRLVVGKSYVSDTFWTDEAKEVSEDSDDESYEDGDEDPYRVAPSLASDVYHSNFIFGVNLADEDLSSLHPPVSQIPTYWDLYLENCETILAVFHKPTTAKIVQEAQEDLSALSKANELLMFTIYFATITSMETDEVKHRFGTDKGSLLTHYENAIQRGLVRIGFLNTQDLTVLQAFVLYLVCIRHSDPAVVWSMTGLAIRISQGMNIDRDGEIFQLSPLKTELRRRIWHQISILDVRASEAKGCFPTPLFYDTKIPSNINDADITPETREYPKPREGITEMTVAVLRYETCEISRRLRRPKLTLEAKEKMIHEFQDNIDQKYLRYCREAGGLYNLSNSITGVVVSRMLLMLYKHQCEEGNAPPGMHDLLFQTATELLEYSFDMIRHPDGMKWSWLFKPSIQWHAVNIVLHELLSRTPSPSTERAWRIIDTTSPVWEVPRDRANKILYIGVQNLLSQAQRHRAAYSQSQSQTQYQSQNQNPNLRHSPEHHQQQPQQGQGQLISPQGQAQQPVSASGSFTPLQNFPTVYNDPHTISHSHPQSSHLQQPQYYVQQGQHIPPNVHPHNAPVYHPQEANINIGAGVGGNMPGVHNQAPWYIPTQAPVGQPQGQPQVQPHPLGLEDGNLGYGSEETWSEYNNLLKNYSMHGGL